MVVAVVCLAALLFTRPGAAAAASVEDEIRAVETARRRAYLAGDYDAVAKLLADDFFLTRTAAATSASRACT